ncbi:MAG TPA: hypothetical protein VH913_25180 [Hyphomicrobiaceae bacterium]|jgi:hypothetical protein
MDLANRYVFLGLIWLIAGMIEGFWMGASGKMEYMTLHIIMVLVGGVLGIVFGTLLRGWPKVGAGGLAKAQFVIWNVGVLGQAGGATTRAWGWGDGPLAIASVLVLLVPVMMLVMFCRHGSAEAR